MRKVVFWGVGLIGLYLVLSNATAGGKLLTSSSDALVPVVKVFQGR